ncbi:MAG: GreA/GreB family elongation factor [Myxococcota bacterium]|nr:GreA/GreB family elongation factor [Myxococcota bacterium]
MRMNPDPDQRFVTTRGGYERLRQRLARARAEYAAVCAENPEAREAGDSSVWHDNFAFEENQRRMHQTARRVRELQDALERLEIIERPTHPIESVSIGVRVRYRLDGEHGDHTYTVAGWGDGDPAARRISYDSHLGQTLLGLRVGDVVEVTIGGRLRSLEVLELSAAEED